MKLFVVDFYLNWPRSIKINKEIIKNFKVNDLTEFIIIEKKDL